MKEPVLQDKQQEFIKFCRYASDLMERVSGKLASANFDASLDEIRRVCTILFSHPFFRGCTEIYR